MHYIIKDGQTEDFVQYKLHSCLATSSSSGSSDVSNGQTQVHVGEMANGRGMCTRNSNPPNEQADDTEGWPLSCVHIQ